MWNKTRDIKFLIYLKKSRHNNSNNNQFIPLPPSLSDEAEIVLQITPFQFHVGTYLTKLSERNSIDIEKKGTWVKPGGGFL